MQIVIFIALMVVYVFLMTITKKLAQNGDLIAAIVLGIGMIFLQPLILGWYIKFLFDVVFSYWTLFGAILVLELFTLKSKDLEME